MADWTFQYPSTTVSRKYDQSSVYIDRLRGEANKLLYELKNLMRFRNLGQLKMTRLFTDGTVITAWSVFGKDFIDIDISRVAITTGVSEEKDQCTITLIDFPSTVPPTTKIGEILPDETEGIDYFKTYYIADVSKCKGCETFGVVSLFTYLDPVVAEHYEDDPGNHSVYSLSPPCRILVIDNGVDDGGQYFRWRAYTETGSELSATGLGVGLLTANIKDEKDEVVCSASDTVKVDCCEKESSLRVPKIWWDYCPYQLSGDCYAPDDPVQYSILLIFQYGIIPLRVHPERDGGCLPFNWTLQGIGELIRPESSPGVPSD